MNSNPRPDDLPPALAAALESLRGVRAPAELSQRVELARNGAVAAPAELWERVAAELAPEFQRRSRRVIAWPRRLAAAAALLLLAGLGWMVWPSRSASPALPGWQDGAPLLAAATSPEAARALRARLVFVDVTPARLSPAAQEFTTLLGLPMREQG